MFPPEKDAAFVDLSWFNLVQEAKQMEKHFKITCLLGVVMLLMTACSPVPVQPGSKEHRAPAAAPYQAILDKSLGDRAVLDFLTSNRCNPLGQYQICQSTGVSLWTDADRIIRTVRLYDEGSSPDHFHYSAVYKRYDMTIIYNSPFRDEDATIHSILISDQL